MSCFAKNPSGTTDRSSALLPEKNDGELHAVVGGARFLAQHGDVERRRPLDQGFEESLTDHAVTDHDQLQSSVHPLRSP